MNPSPINKLKHFHLDKKKKSSLIKEISKVLDSRKEILFAYIYGSFLEEGNFRDIDIAVDVGDINEKTDFVYEENLEKDLKKSLSINIPVDVRVINRSPISFKYQVLKGRLIVNHNEEKRVDFTVHTVSRYLDLESVLSYYQKEAFIP
jgi:predicted nucleotidyltransferase